MSLDPHFFMIAVNKLLDDVDKARANSDRAKCPSWSEVLDYDALFKQTGVQMADLWNFTHSGVSDACVNELYKHFTSSSYQ